ncbi:hypothetical protein PORY_002288 [Pneumocystis oryctolagi]|uniref:Uncharacterized protein n=1 Tax=Pneumocystis oryctolagi TaxID=42067 RepID=A0ACB7CBK9_9ASCO|nr:hypothetical protein PORY_002288 [Pneumocystis oryctolagi]
MNYLDEVKLWNEERVGEWLKMNDFGEYVSVFYNNNINGDILLDCDSTLLKELGIFKLSDRIRLLVCIKKLRNKCIASVKKARLGIFIPNSKLSNTEDVQQSPTDPLIPNKPSCSFETLPSFHIDSHRSDTCSINSENSCVLGNFSSSVIKTPEKDLYADTMKKSEKSSVYETDFNNPEYVKKDCFNPIEEKEQIQTANIDHCKTTNEKLPKTPRKLSMPDRSSCLRFCISQDNKPYCKCISDDMFLSIPCQHLKLEKEKYVLKDKDSPITLDGFEVSQMTSKERADFVYNAVMSKTTGNLRKLETFFGEKFKHAFESSIVSPLPSLHKGRLGGTKRIRSFFGQRPPSEHISLNLEEYFPGHEKKVLEQTVKNSIKRSTLLNASKKSGLNTSNSDTLAYGVSSMPTVGETWMQFGEKELSKNSRRFSLSYFVSTQFSTLFEPTSKKSVYQDSILPLESSTKNNFIKSEFNTENNTSYIKPNFYNELENRELSIETFKSESSSVLEKSLDTSAKINEKGLDDNIFKSDCKIKDLNIENEMDNNNNSGPTRWIKGALIGSGSFGSVFLGMNALSGELMAVKQVEIPSYDIQGCKRKKAMLDALQREISLLKELHHENIVQYLGSSMDETHLTFFLEYVPGGSVTALLNSYGAFEEPLIRNFVRQILKGLNYLHNKKIIHRDIKGANILVDNKGVIKISDFGISKKVETNLLSISKNHRPSLQGSVYWMAPEVVKQTLYTRKADIWSLGCLVVEMFTGEHPFPKMNQLQAIFKIGQHASPEIPKYCSIEAKEFLEKTFEPDYHARPTAADLLKYNFLGPMVSSPQSCEKK